MRNQQWISSVIVCACLRSVRQIPGAACRHQRRIRLSPDLGL